MSKAPPIGIEPEWIWRRRRAEDLRQAIDRFIADDKLWQIERWLGELEQHQKWLEEYGMNRKSPRVLSRDLSSHQSLELILRVRAAKVPLYPYEKKR